MSIATFALSVYLSAGGHFDLGYLLRPVGEDVNVHFETNKEVLLCCLQEVFQEHDVPVQKVRGVISVSKVKPKTLKMVWKYVSTPFLMFFFIFNVLISAL